MTIDEAIAHCEGVADMCAVTDGNIECENNHRQLAEWLKDYKRLLAKESGVDIRCGNCKHDDNSGYCDTCSGYGGYSKWEVEDESE